jgi:hypothetical protein
MRAIDALTLGLRLLAPDMETVQLYWLPLGESYFDEEHCQRCIVRASNEPQDLTFAFTGTVKKVVFDIKPHLTSEDEQALHESAHHGHVAHGISG